MDKPLIIKCKSITISKRPKGYRVRVTAKRIGDFVWIERRDSQGNAYSFTVSSPVARYIARELLKAVK